MASDAPWPARDFDPHELLNVADFFKREGEDVSEDLRDLEGRILDCLAGRAGFEAAIPQALLPEVGAEIFDTLLSDYLKWYKCRVIAVRMPANHDRLAFAGYVQIEKPLHLGLGIVYELTNAGRESAETAAPLPRLGLVPDSVRIVVDAAMSIRAAVAAMKIEKSIHQMLSDPAGIVRKTLECRLRAAYNYRQPLGNIGLSIASGTVNVGIYAAAA